MRAVRVLRPLRTVNRVPGMRVLVRSLLDALPAMGSVVVLTSFIFLVFGIIGVELFQGMLHDRCYAAQVGGLHVTCAHARPVQQMPAPCVAKNTCMSHALTGQNLPLRAPIAEALPG